MSRTYKGKWRFEIVIIAGSVKLQFRVLKPPKFVIPMKLTFGMPCILDAYIATKTLFPSKCGVGMCREDDVVGGAARRRMCGEDDVVGSAARRGMS